MGKLRDKLLEDLLGMERFRKVNPNQIKAHIEKRLHESILNYHVPTHPPYASMIRMAIFDLTEKGGSSEEAISAFIKREYKDLPWAHDSFLSHYLGKLCGNLDLVKSNDGRYMLPMKSGDSGNIRTRGRKRRRCKGRQGKDKDRNESEDMSQVVENVFQESSDSERDQFEVDKNVEASSQPENAEELRRERIKLKAEQIKVSEDHHKVEMQPTEVTEQQIEGNYDHSVFVMERRKESLDEDRWGQGNSLDSKEIVEDKQQLHELEDELVGGQGPIEELQNDTRDKILTSCCDGEGNDAVNMRVQSGESSLLVMEAEEREFSMQEDQPLRSPAQVQHPESSGAERSDQRRGRLQRPEHLGLPDADILNALLLPNSKYENEEQQQQEVQGSGACPKSNVQARSIKVPSTQSATDRNHNEQPQKQQQQRQVRCRGRPPKAKEAHTTLDASLLKFNVVADSLTVPSTQSPSDRSHNKQLQQPQVRRRGRPPKLKAKEAMATTLDASSLIEADSILAPSTESPSDRNHNEQLQQRQVRRRANAFCSLLNIKHGDNRKRKESHQLILSWK